MVGITIAAFISITLIGLLIRVHMDRRDAAVLVAGNPYPRKFHVFAETKSSEKLTSCDFTPI